jgi:hypothetical protein
MRTETIALDIGCTDVVWDRARLEIENNREKQR